MKKKFVRMVCFMNKRIERAKKNVWRSSSMVRTSALHDE